MEYLAGIYECPFCMAVLLQEEREAGLWLVCPNGCPGEYELTPESQEERRALSSGTDG